MRASVKTFIVRALGRTASAILLRRVTFLACAATLSGCDGVPVDGSHTVAECPAAEMVCIRVENTSKFDFQQFEVNFEGQTVSFGPLAAGAISGYREVDAAYSYAFTEAFSDGRRFVLQPIDFVGEQHLGPGAYTYRYTVDIFDQPRVQGDWRLDGYMDVQLVSVDEKSE